MIIKSISLINFRSHNQYHLDLNPDITLILGPNGCGKTSVLEALYILTRGKSFRATDPDIVKKQTDFYRIKLEYSSGETIVAVYDGKTKTFQVSDKKTRRLPAKYKYPVVLFLPSDLNLVSGSPSRRRDYFDRLFSQLDEEYSVALSRYDKALRQRNELLKSENVTRDQLFSWNLMLAKYGSLIEKGRNRYIEALNNTLETVYHSIARNNDRISLLYQTEIPNLTESRYLEVLDQNATKDFYLGHTSFGVHRDDIDFIFNDKNADGSASRGETRSLILALKFVEASLLTSTLGKKPLVLLDDVFSELDHSRRRCLVDNFKSHQVIITSVEDVRNLPNKE